MKLPRNATEQTSARGYLDGQMLIAMPAMNDERFARTLIYVCAHSSEGAMGIVVNQPAGNIKFPDLLVQLEVIPAAERIELPTKAEDVKVLKGGPVETGRGFVLHSADYFIENSTLPIDEGICLTATLDILKAIARGNGPASAILALGYAGWAPGQLEHEIQENGWLHCAADFGIDFRQRHRRQIPEGAAQDRHRPRHAVERSRPRLKRRQSSSAKADDPVTAIFSIMTNTGITGCPAFAGHDR